MTRSFNLLLTQQEALDFAAGCLGERVHELDLARVGVGRESLLDEPLLFYHMSMSRLREFSCVNELRRLEDFDVIAFQAKNTLSTMNKKTIR